MLRTLFFCVLIVVGGVLAKEKHKTEEASSVVPPTLPPHETTSTSTTTTTTTTTSTTEKPTTTSTTEKPTTTSTTEKPTTTSTTEKPTTTSTVKPSTTPVPPTPSPTPQPANQVGVWNVTEVVNNKTSACIVASMAVNITVHYEKVDPKNASLHWNATQVFSVPASAKASGTCGNTSQSLTLSWTIDNATLSLKFQFDQNNQSAFMLSSVKASIPATKALFPDIALNATTFELSSLNKSDAIPLHQSYLCRAGVNFTLANSAQNKNATPADDLLLSQVQFQAFAHVEENKFDTAVNCAADSAGTPDYIPILVGLSLAALVIAVLAAYVIGRRRSAARGYLSM
ncbi:hypothetical protein M8J76_000767 [Diaphorina citri]|nr:hypothetical protein M8J75_010580 [Diaphorina citri]KAI5736184.1 hypothetical protein M8J76_000767 [Diaphorina citri]